ncbi:RICIN domain-containing protein [Streptomyces gobitricini]|uniref:Ricin B lectin domain-containing protein n=1 Tax=Streptomyces gobitricini TaxID=68211 RepID=A0ABP5ZM94_9ACTN
MPHRARVVRRRQRTRGPGACGSGANQQWQITPLADGEYRLTARHSGKCLTIAYDPVTAGPKGVQYTCQGTATHRWKRAGAPY